MLSRVLSSAWLPRLGIFIFRSRSQPALRDFSARNASVEVEHIHSYHGETEAVFVNELRESWNSAVLLVR